MKIINDFKGGTYSISELKSIYNTDNKAISNWVYKYEKYGVEGSTRAFENIEELTSEEKMKLEIRRTEKENERLRTENAFLKKLEEIERWRE